MWRWGFQRSRLMVLRLVGELETGTIVIAPGTQVRRWGTWRTPTFALDLSTPVPPYSWWELSDVGGVMTTIGSSLWLLLSNKKPAEPSFSRLCIRNQALMPLLHREYSPIILYGDEHHLKTREGTTSNISTPAHSLSRYTRLQRKNGD